MVVVRRAPPRSKPIQSLDEFRRDCEIALAGRPAEWIAEEVKPLVEREAMERADLERWAQRGYDTAPQRDYTRAITGED